MIEQIGKHRVRCGDVYDNLDELFNGEKADIYYSDPPWGEGNLKYWQTMNAKMNEGATKKEVNLNTFLNRIFEVSNKYTKDDAIIFIEYGMAWNNDLIKLAEEHYGLKCIKSIEMLYGTPKRPLILNIFTKGKELQLSEEYIQSVYHTSGIKSLESAITPFVKEGMTICDLCCGLGYTAQFAVNHKLKFIGNELNQARLNRTKERLRKDK